MSSLLQVQNLSKSFNEVSKLLFNDELHAVKNVSFTLERKKTLAIVGYSGSGKSTLAKMLAGVIKPSSGNIIFNGTPLQFGDYQKRANHIRMVFQDPNQAFSPIARVEQILNLPLQLLTDFNQQDRNDRITEILQLVGLNQSHLDVQMRKLTWSQKQRVALARALIVEPEIIITDDILSGVDSSVKAQIINLMLEVQDLLDVSYIYISSQLGMVKHTADDILVMNNGEVIEYGNTKEVLCNPQREITARLIESHFGGKLTEANFINQCPY